MKKSFSLFELIIAVTIISILYYYFLVKSDDSIEFAQKVKIKSQIALIRNSINKLSSSKILLNEETEFNLDDEVTNQENCKLFSNILSSPLISTSSLKKELGKWIKSSKDEYEIYINSAEKLQFRFEDLSFKCVSEIGLCKEFE